LLGAYGIFSLPLLAWAQEDGNLPDIEARLYRVKTQTVSRTGSVYLLKRLAASKPPADAQYDSIPAERKLLVLKTGETNIMALRVLKDLPDSGAIIAKKIREYDDLHVLPMSQEYVAVEKISDLLPPPPTEQDKKDIEEVAPPLAYDPELDAGSSPAPNAAAEEEDEKILGRVADDNEDHPFRHHWVSVVGGLFSNTPNGYQGLDLQYYLAGGLKYQYDFKERIWYKSGKTYDTLGIEGGLFLYKIVGLNSLGGDSYTVLPINAVLRYTIYPTENFGYSFYGGIEHNAVLVSTPPTGLTSSDSTFQSTISHLSSTLPALGVGANYRFGPGWYVRADIGIDMLTVGLSLHF
jgi:hypothetical protein